MLVTIEYNYVSHSCQEINGKMSDVSSGGSKSIEIEIDEKITKNTVKVAALKEFYKNHLPYQFGNSVTFVTSVKVTL